MAKSKKERPKEDPATTRLKEISRKIAKELENFRKAREDKHCYPLFLGATSIGPRVVDDIYDDLRKEFAGCEGKLDVLIDSSGGDIDAAYNLAQLFRRYATADLTFIVPRWAKSAATLLVCSGDRILMTPVAELGPMDPQITEMNPLEGRLERFSPLHIDSTLALIREEFKTGSTELAQALMQRLQFPLTLGSIRKSLDISKQYLIRLLSTRMFKSDATPVKKAEDVAGRLTESYADHGFCINLEEAKAIGLVAEELGGDPLDIAWRIHRLNVQRNDLLRQKNEEEMKEKIKDLPPDILDRVLPKAGTRDGAPHGKP